MHYYYYLYCCRRGTTAVKMRCYQYCCYGRTPTDSVIMVRYYLYICCPRDCCSGQIMVYYLLMRSETQYTNDTYMSLSSPTATEQWLGSDLYVYICYSCEVIIYCAIYSTYSTKTNHSTDDACKTRGKSSKYF